MSTSFKHSGVNPFTGALKFQAGAPLDNRFVVSELSDLMNSNIWLVSGTDIVYTGLPVYVLENKSWYISTDDEQHKTLLKAYNDTHEFAEYWSSELPNVWSKISTENDLKNLGGVFKFQGVASAIDADHCTLTVEAATKRENNITTTDKEGKQTTGIQTVSYNVTDYKVDVEGDTYFLWTSTATGALRYWTRGDFANGTKFYNVSKDKAETFTYKTETYYQTGETSNSRTKYLTLDGDVLWVEPIADTKTGYIYATSASNTKVQEGTVTLTPDRELYLFTEAGTFTTVVKSGASRPASGHSGEVYQLGDEEYASNGTIWVQLGSPKEDWIVIK